MDKLVLKYKKPNFLPEKQEILVEEDDPFIIASSIVRLKDASLSTAEMEASLSLKKALQMKKNGNFEKALKLFQHAIAIHPLQPDVLNRYGEFLEETNQDIVEADHLYNKALILCPNHSRALMNRERTLPIVKELDEKQLNAIDSKRKILLQIPPNDSALKRMKKEAYFQHIYHAVALEGNTMTLGETRMILETGTVVPGKSITEHNEVIGLEAALVYINSNLANKYGLILIEDILQIHKRVLGHVDPIEAGTLRNSQVYVGEFIPSPPMDLPLLMSKFVDWINSEETVTLHPVKFAALAHYKLVFIHPFIDGNGRTARLLMNLILMRASYPPVIIRKQDRSIYYEYLQVANEGDIRPFLRFIAECTEKTLDMYLYATEMKKVYNVCALEHKAEKCIDTPQIKSVDD